MKKRIKVFTLLMTAVISAVVLCGCLTGCKEPTQEENVGKMYRLNEAYEQGIVTTEELRNIAFYYNIDRQPDDWEEEDDSFVPLPLEPKELNSEVEHKIKKAYANDILEDSAFPLHYLEIDGYYGTYREKIAVRIFNNSIKISVMPDLPEYEEIGGVLFFYYFHNIYIWEEAEKQEEKLCKRE